MLDEKDDEIQEQSGLVEKLKEQMLEQEELISATRRDYENLTKEMSKMQVIYLPAPALNILPKLLQTVPRRRTSLQRRR